MVSARWFGALASRIAPLFLPASLVYIVETRLCPIIFARLVIPSWVVVLTSLAALPVYIASSFGMQDMVQHWKAYRAGATMVPLVPDPTFGVMTIGKLLRGSKYYPGVVHMQWVEKYGPTFRMRLIGRPTTIFTLEPEYIKQILANQFENFTLKIREGALNDLLGSGVFNSDGEIWKMHRNASRPYFTKERIAHLENFEQHAELALKLACQRLREGHPIDFQDLIARFTLDSATQFLFDYDVQSLNAGLPYSHSSGVPNTPHFSNHPSNAFADAFLEGQLISDLRIRTGKNAPLFEVNGNPIPPLRAIIDPYIDIILEQVMERKNKGDKVDEEGLSLLEHLIDFMDDPVALKDEVINILVAGRDTTASLLTFTVYLLAQHPEVCKKLRAEVIECVGLSERPTPEAIKSMKYLRAVLNETLRLYSTVPFNGKRAVKDTVLKNKDPNVPDIFVPAGTNVLYSTFLMQRRPELWGPDAHLFDPERFLDSRLSTYITPNPFIFLPFNAGPRICLGQQFAYTEASYFMIKLLQQFVSFELAKDAMLPECIPPQSYKAMSGRIANEEIIPKTHLTMSVSGGLWVRMKEDDMVAQ
ncbi:cytochrome P450 monooxygenase pc-1 [Flagelloscypha sp. PMI_526]|nr:cytochrome P450 monooxygenase pc-1 [Flagelloscypha sp. PMI_526]